MKKSAALVAIGVLALTACGSAESEPEKKIEASPNSYACALFGVLTYDLAEPFQEDLVIEPWEKLRDDFDAASLEAEGDVKERLQTLVEEWPEASQILIYGDGISILNDNVESVARACKADGAPADYTTLAE